MKEIKSFTPGEQIPSNATFLTADLNDGAFWYEVPIKVERSKSGKSMVEFMPDIKAIVDYLNMQTGKSYRYQTGKTQKLIFKWLKEGWTVQEFKTAIDNMCSEWLTDPKMSAYLRPETLFGNKFEGYFNRHQGQQSNDIFGELDDILGGIE